MKKIILHSSFVFICFTFFSCTDRNEYRVPEEVAVYVDRFEKEAALRGRNFDFKNQGLIVEFADLKDNVAGLCHFEKPIRIEIDEEYWNRINDNVGADLMREELLFHEIGHGILNRKHHNSLLKNGEWKSMMCGGDSIEGKSWNINYRGVRRDYYLDELFNQSTPPPEFTSLPNSFDTSGFAPVYAEQFDSYASSKWILKENPRSSTYIENGQLVFKSNTSSNMFVVVNVYGVDVQSDFVFEASLTLPSVNLVTKFGLAFGTTQNGTFSESFDFILINNNKEKYFGNSGWFSYYTKLSDSNIFTSKKNNLKIVKQKGMIYYFINGKFAYSTEIENTQQGFSYGFIAPANETLYVDDVVISSRKSTALSSRIKQADVPLEFETISIELPENRLHYK